MYVETGSPITTETDTRPIPVQILFHAADLILRDGWTRGQEVNHQGERCAMGAVRQSAVDLGYSSEGDEFGAAITFLVAHLDNSVAGWNDGLAARVWDGLRYKKVDKYVADTLRAAADRS